MDKGIRNGVNIKFAEMLPQLAAIGGRLFRKTVIDWTIDNYGVTIASAATHYNYSLKQAQKTTPALVVGLGRPPEKNNGGRKKKVVDLMGPVQPAAIEAAVEKAAIEYTETEQTEFKVCKKSDGTVIAEGLSFEDARAVVEKAAQAKKAKLYWI